MGAKTWLHINAKNVGLQYDNSQSIYVPSLHSVQCRHVRSSLFLLSPPSFSVSLSASLYNRFGYSSVPVKYWPGQLTVESINHPPAYVKTN